MREGEVFRIWSGNDLLNRTAEVQKKEEIA